MEEGKISQGESEEEIALWGEEIEANLERADNTTRRIHDAIKAIDLEERKSERRWRNTRRTWSLSGNY